MKLPPLNALRAFDAVARHGGVRLAAEALFVTPSAISQQVRHLEKHLGVTLLERNGRLIALTEAGKSLHANTSKHLRAIALAADSLRPRQRTVRLTTVPSFAVRWLVPRLKAFTDAHRDVEVRVEANPELADLNSGQWDLAIREGQGRYPGTTSQLLFDLALIPVTSPAYARRLFSKKGGGWAKARLLHEAGHPWWQQWSAAMQEPSLDLSAGLYFSHTIMLIAAALDGQGIALVPHFFIDAELADGSLVTVDPRPLQTDVGLYAVWSSAGEDKVPVAAKVFRDWVLNEAALHRQSITPAKASNSRRPTPTIGETS